MTAKTASKPAPAPISKGRKKTSAAEQKRLKLGLPNSAVDPGLSKKRAAAGMIGGVMSQIQNASTYEIAHIAMQAGAKSVVNHGVMITKQLAKKEAASVLQRMVELASGMHDARPREQIAAGRIVLEVAGALEKDAEGGDDSPLTQRSVSALRAVIASGEERIQELQAEIERQAAADLVAIDGVHRTIDLGDG